MSFQRSFFLGISSLTRRTVVQSFSTQFTSSTYAPGRKMAQPFASLAASPSKTNAQKRFNVVIIGCSYAGMSAAATLTALKDGLPIPFESYGDYSHLRNSPSIRNFNITMIDERDGFCNFPTIPFFLQWYIISDNFAAITSPYRWSSFSPRRTFSNKGNVEIVQGIFEIESFRYYLHSRNSGESGLPKSRNHLL